MLHSFVAAKLLPQLPTWARYGQRILPSLTTKPFFALHFQLPTEHSPWNRAASLFVVSRYPPNFPGSEYFILNQTVSEKNARTLTVVPPLPFKEPLYLFLTPRIAADFKITETYQRLVNAEKYQLDETSLVRFLKALKDAGPSIPFIRETGGNDKPEPHWDAWSGTSQREAPGFLNYNHEVQLSFDLVPFESLPTNIEHHHLFEEMALLRQLTLDYTWEGCSFVTNYIDLMRDAFPRFAAAGKIIRLPVLPTRRPDPCVDALRPCTPHLKSLPVIHDGDPGPDDNADEYDWADDWNDKPEAIVRVPEAVKVPAVEAKNINLIVLDSNIFIDRDGPLQEALVHIFPPLQHHFAPKELLNLYVEYETLQAANRLSDSPIAVFQDIARYLSVSIDESALSAALDHHAQPRLYPETSAVIKLLTEQGYSLLVLPTSSPNNLILLSQLTGHLSPPGTLSSSWKWESLSENHPNLHKSQILVVTSDIYRIAEPASMAGFPIAFIKRTGSRSAYLSLPTAPPTFTLTTLTELLHTVTDTASVPEPQDPVVNRRCPPMRIRDCYQATHFIGSGSFAAVFQAMQVHTGVDVAIKFEEKCTTLPYEAAVYAQLDGVSGLPRIHWSGAEESAYAIVMDRLGPNLEQLRRFCRGRVELRTVLMLGEQMLSTIEAIHARGIIVRDIKPKNFAIGLVEDHKRLHLLDLGLCKLWLDPMTGTHMPFREGRAGIGTPRYASANVHFGLEPSRRDDVEAIGFLLLYLLHGRLPWQGIGAVDIPSKLRRIGEMKKSDSKPFTQLLFHKDTPEFFGNFFNHCRSLAFEAQPDYEMLRGLLRKEFEAQGWGEYDWVYAWFNGNGSRGTLMPEEYRHYLQLVEPVRHTQVLL